MSALEKLHDTLAAQVGPGGVPGLIAAVVHDGAEDVFWAGTRTIGEDAPVGRDTIVRIASMSKPMLAFVALRLVDEGVLRLDDPVGRWLPELARPRVLRHRSGPVDDTVPADREIVVRDLLAFTAGFGMVMAPPGTYPVQAAIEAALGPVGPPRPAEMLPGDEFLARLGALPLLHQPGAEWMYHLGSDVLGLLLARATGASPGEVMREWLFDPLGMKDTGFQVLSPDRLATSYTGALEVFDPAEGSQWLSPPVMESGGGGLASTVDDCLAFTRLMLGGGVSDGRRLLSSGLFAEMTRDQLTPGQKARTTWIPGFFDTHGWGYGTAVRTVAGDGESAGSYGWTGGLGTAWACDPVRGTAGILLTQRAMTSPVPSTVMSEFWAAVHEIGAHGAA